MTKQITTLKVRAARNLVAQGVPRKRVSVLLGVPLGTISHFLDRGNETYNMIDNWK